MDSATVGLIVAVPILVWFATRLIPSSLTKFIAKEIDRRSDSKLERIKAEFQGSYSTLKSSVDVLVASNSGIHPHIIDSVSGLWAQMMEMRDKLGAPVTFDSVILAKEAQEAFSQEGYNKLLNYVQGFKENDYSNKLLTDFSSNSADKFRLFCGDRVWFIFYVYRAVMMRNALLISWSFKERAYRDWRSDSVVLRHLDSLPTKNDMQQLRESQLGGLASALALLETEFLHEATRVMSGSKAMADSLADVQAALLFQHAKVAEQNDKK